MKDKIAALLTEIEAFVPENADALEAFRLKFMSKKGLIAGLFADFKTVAPEDRKEMGVLLNELKDKAQGRLNQFRQIGEIEKAPVAKPDLTLPAGQFSGGRHPLSIVRNQINSIFKRIGFTISEGPEIEDDFHNFTALNFPPEHPARDM